MMRLLSLCMTVCVILRGIAGASLPFLSSDGICKPASQITAFLEKGKVDSSKPCSVIGVVDLTNDGSGCKLTNSVLSTSFPDLHNGICLDTVTGSSAVLLAQYDAMFSSKYCGSKATDFFGLLADSIVVVLPQQEISLIMSGHDQTFRRLANAAKRQRLAGSDRGVKNICFLSGTQSEQVPSTYSQEIVQAFETIWSDVCGSAGGTGGIPAPNTLVVMVNDKDPESINAAKAAILKVPNTGDAEYQASGALGGKIAEAWGKVASGIPRPLFSPQERLSVHIIESAFTAGVAQSEATFNQWQARIGSGKVVGKFGSRVQELLDSVHKRFMEQTKASISVRERAVRARQLRENIEAVAGTMFRQQLVILQSLMTNRFRKTLISFAVEGKEQDEADAKEEEQQALRKALFDFRTMASDLEVESLGFVSTAAQSELSSNLQTLATEFPESSFGRLEAAKKVERETKRPKKKRGSKSKGSKGSKGKRALNIGLNLVGMLRPPGYGNLQGFVGYSTALLGLPLEILMGVQNDGDSPEVMGEDREYPLLRLQPKVSFDIDV